MSALARPMLPLPGSAPATAAQTAAKAGRSELVLALLLLSVVVLTLTRSMFIIVALVAVLALSTGTAVAHTGLIAFVGLAAPHLVRSIVKTTHGRLVLLSAAMGGLLLMAADVLARWGGEEFLLMLDGTGPESAFRIADRLRELVNQAQVASPAGTIRYQVSMGVTSTDKSGYTLNQLVLDADAALYRAKQEGRNRVCLA